MTSPQPNAFSLGRTLARIIAWLVVLVVVLIAALAGFILLFDWNHAKPYVNDKVSEAIGRPFAIEGDLKVGWRRPPGETGWRAWVPWPRFSATQIAIANPAWTQSPHFATLDEIDFEVAVLPLLAHDIVIPAINLVNPSVDVERLTDGRNNWTFQLPASSGPSTWRLNLHDITFSSGNIAVSDQQTKTDVKIAVSLLGQGIPIGEVMAQQEAASRQGSAQVIGRAGANRLAQQAREQAASEAAAASAASEAAAASGAVASGAIGAASTANATSAPGVTSATSAPAVGSQALAASAASGASGAKPPARQPFYAIGWTIKGTYNKTPLSGEGKLGGVLALQDAKRPFPIQADVRAGDMHIALVGTLTDPAHLAAVDLRLWLQGQSMGHLYNLTGVTLPETPPYATEGRFVGQFHRGASVFRYENFTGRVGGSDLNGTLVYEQRSPRPLLSGVLVSNLLQFSDLAPIIGADSKAIKEKRGDTVSQPADRVIPVEPFRTNRWNAIDADVKFTGRRIIKQGSLPIQDLYTHLSMTNGVLVFDPLQFGVAGGTLATRLSLDGSGEPLKARGTVEARHLKLKQLFPSVKSMQSALGEINGDASLSATGNSPAALAATSNGEVKLLVTQGTISRLLMEAAGLNVANVVYEKLFGTRDVKINCAAADFVATNGTLDPRVFALDTDDAVINIDGPINLHDESLDMKVHPHTKGFRIFTLRSPLYVKGTFKNPHVGVDATALALRGGAMIGLGLINPFAALIPLIAPSNNKPLPCDELFAQMRQHPVAPPPGQKMHAAALPKLPAGNATNAGSGAKEGGGKSTGGNASPATRTQPAPSTPQSGPSNLYRGS
ncbi:AsmA domain-containing protein [Paraburkholderia unamae]|uniref:AsmA family protein n=1 Tax=Paraburkholderia unamae TaxID=219649 RepID=UPI001CAB0530|nr:AsmA family protein [Paraburkholderia unamae]CAG9259006.1 AsmA domain-containing protein [Paraburkholderia unamae]